MYTLELYKSDKRTAAGERLESKKDGYTAMSQWDLDALKRRLSTQYPSPKYRIELHETMVTKKNILLTTVHPVQKLTGVCNGNHILGIYGWHGRLCCMVYYHWEKSVIVAMFLYLCVLSVYTIACVIAGRII